MRILASFVTATILALGNGALPGGSIAHADNPCYEVIGTTISKWIETCSDEVIIGPEITAIYPGVFDPSNSISSIGVIPQGISSVDMSQATLLTTISPHAFSNNSNLTNVKLPPNLTTISDSAFEGDRNITEINFPSSLTAIGTKAFAGPQLKQITIPDSVVSIGDLAFSNDDALETITVGSGLTTLGLFALPQTFTGTVIVNPANTGFTVSSAGNLIASGCLPLTGVPDLGEDAPASSVDSSDPKNLLVTIPIWPYQHFPTVSPLTLATTSRTESLPSTTLQFCADAPTELRVTASTNPITASATPFVTSDVSIFVDIQPSPSFNLNDHSFTVCLAGASTDHIFQFQGSTWTELPAQTHLKGFWGDFQVCGLASSFSRFAVGTPGSSSQNGQGGGLIDMPLVPDPSPKVGGGSNPSQDPQSGNSAGSQDPQSGNSAGSVDSSVSGCTGLMGVSCNTNANANTNTNSQINDAPALSITAGTTANSRVATIPTGVTSATIPATTYLPATTMLFSGVAPTSVILAPVAVNPAPASATPFTLSPTTKIVDISITGTITAPVTVCLDGASTDHLFHYTGGSWVELPSRSYVNGQVCGVTTSFSPFAAAAPAALIATPVPDPVQQSKITALSLSSAIAGTPTPVVISGSFIEKISAIQINGVALAAGSWSQTQTSVTFTMPGKSAGTYQIQIYNGSAPVMKVQNFTFTAPIVVVAPTPAPTVKQKVTYIRCAKPGHGTRIAYGVNPTCPAGYVKK